MSEEASVVRASDVRFRYSKRGPEVVRGVSLSLTEGESVGLVGESGSGKTTFGRILLGTLDPTAGTVEYGAVPEGAKVAVSAVFQDVSGSIDPLYRARRAIEEGSVLRSRDARRSQATELLARVGLDSHLAERFPHQLSGGQRQRVCVARALATGARAMVLDEPTSALDAQARLQMVELLNGLRSEGGFAYVVISHDFQAISRLCSRVLVMLNGEIIEQGLVSEVLGAPEHSYTRELVNASTTRRAEAEEIVQPTLSGKHEGPERR
jgi:peptide/nickel transport system ATP-binding protein